MSTKPGFQRISVGCSHYAGYPPSGIWVFHAVAIAAVIASLRLACRNEDDSDDSDGDDDDDEDGVDNELLDSDEDELDDEGQQYLESLQVERGRERENKILFFLPNLGIPQSNSLSFLTFLCLYLFTISTYMYICMYNVHMCFKFFYLTSPFHIWPCSWPFVNLIVFIKNMNTKIQCNRIQKYNVTEYKNTM